MWKRRTFEAVLGEGLWPTGVTGGLSVDWQESRRHMAIAEVLTDIPDEDFDLLREQGYTFSWFIPLEWMRAEIRPIPSGATKGTGLTQMQYGKEVFLSPLLERAAWDVLVGLVAHELAHIALGHSLFPGKEYKAGRRKPPGRWLRSGDSNAKRRKPVPQTSGLIRTRPTRSVVYCRS